MKHQHLRAPADHRGTFIRPGLAHLAQAVSDNRNLLRDADFIIAGRRAADLRRQLRAAVLKLARDYTAMLNPQTPLPRPDPDAPLIMTGHQPDLFHPGVWFKNHLADRLAHLLSGTSLNLVLDSDLPHLAGLALPVRTGDNVTLETFTYARVIPGRTYEEHAPDSSWRVDDFIAEVASVLPVPQSDSLFSDFAPRLKHSAATALNIAALAAAARNSLERSLGLSGLEVSASSICSTREFMLFVLSVVADLERFRAVYNSALALRRKLRGIRQKANPLPDLGVDETPFWIYSKGGERQPLMVRREGNRIELLFRGEPFFTVQAGSRDPEAFDEVANELLRKTTSANLRIRTRALTTTMMLRLFVADVFIHGIGGAGYDAVTDMVIKEYFGVAPPAFITASATMRLPFKSFPATKDDRRRLERFLRDLEWNPDRHLAGAGDEVRSLIELKRELISRRHPDTRRQRHEVFESIRSANKELRAFVAPEMQFARRELAKVQRDLDFNRILTGREYAFILFGRDDLLGFYRDALRDMK